jgi:predicted metal-binding membrane protein
LSSEAAACAERSEVSAGGWCWVAFLLITVVDVYSFTFIAVIIVANLIENNNQYS